MGNNRLKKRESERRKNARERERNGEKGMSAPVGVNARGLCTDPSVLWTQTDHCFFLFFKCMHLQNKKWIWTLTDPFFPVFFFLSAYTCRTRSGSGH